MSLSPSGSVFPFLSVQVVPVLSSCWSRFYGLGLLFIDDPLRESVMWVRKLRLA
jgi:hypothetical protein